jgi:hypothetical protein
MLVKDTNTGGIHAVQTKQSIVQNISLEKINAHRDVVMIKETFPVVQRLPGMCMVLGLIPGTKKEKTKTKKAHLK